jgi:hypothetical protein
MTNVLRCKGELWNANVSMGEEDGKYLFYFILLQHFGDLAVLK